ncbi:hypothetical protein ACE38W_14785 [Chitinophaga sp. Hz27]|uniref:hypothetical protein n=1 Tax=Chitinophaga sp. Hz27 TaxID=3347169 RepID=UPI0035DF328D
MKFYNTIGLSGEELKDRQEKNITQTDAVMRLFNKYPDKKFTAREVYHKLTSDGIRAELTSIRRAISDLEDAGNLVKLDETVRSPVGRGMAEHYHCLPPVSNIEAKQAIADGYQPDLYNLDE